MINDPRFTAKFNEGWIEAVRTGLEMKPIVAKGLSIQVTPQLNGKFRLRAFLVDEKYNELMEVASHLLQGGEVLTLIGLDQPFTVRLG